MYDAYLKKNLNVLKVIPNKLRSSEYNTTQFSHTTSPTSFSTAAEVHLTTGLGSCWGGSHRFQLQSRYYSAHPTLMTF